MIYEIIQTRTGRTARGKQGELLFLTDHREALFLAAGINLHMKYDAVHIKEWTYEIRPNLNVSLQTPKENHV